MKSSIIHNNHAFSLKAWDKRVFAPVIKYIAIDILLKVIKRKQHFFIERTNNISTLSCLPVIAINTSFTNRCISVRSYAYSLKATLIHMNNGEALLRKAIKLILIYRTFYWTSFWML
jgi:hypothetical protein